MKQGSPQDRHAIALMGLNGVGKTTITGMIQEMNSDFSTIHASEEIRSYLGINRDTQNKMSVSSNITDISIHLATVLRSRLEVSRFVLFDTQLLVPSNDAKIPYDSCWSELYTPYISDAYLITASIGNIVKWRKHDLQATGRIRGLDSDKILAQQSANTQEFARLIDVGLLPEGSLVVENVPAAQYELARFIVNRATRVF